jgi:hypothetical protein
MDKVDASLRMLQTLVESAGGSIEPFRHILVQNADRTSESDIAQLSALEYTAIDGFFHCAAKNLTFTDIGRIRQFFGRTLEEAYPGASPTFMQLASTYWTFKLLLNESMPASSVVGGLLQAIDILFAGVFFPTPGPLGRPKEERETTMRFLIQQSGANLDLEDYIRGNFYLR